MDGGSSLLTLARFYADRGIRVFPCGKDKKPLTEHGFHDASTDPDQLTAWFLNKEIDSFYIGVQTGMASGGIVIVDIDVGKDNDIRTTDEKRQYIEDNYGPLPDTLTILTPSGGKHLWYRHTEPVKCRNKFLGKDVISIDVKADGGYVIAPDETNYITYDSDFDTALIQPLPEWIVNVMLPGGQGGETRISGLVGPEVYTGDIPLVPEQVQSISRALEFLDADSRDSWIKYGMALKSLNSDEAKRLWYDWSMQSKKFDARDQERVWKSFRPNQINIATMFFDAKINGYEENREMAISPEAPEKFRQEKQPFPIELLNPPGLVGDLVNVINSQSIKYQPILALGAALSLAGCIMGRKIQTETRIRTNLYVVGVGETGSGKDAARQTIKQILTECGAAHLCAVEDIASDAAIISYLEANPSSLFLLDEIGRFISVTQSTAKNPFLYNIVGQLIKLYGSAASTYHGKVYRDKTNNMLIHQPNACIYGTTVPTTLYESLSSENITDGLINRFLIFESEDTNPQKRKSPILWDIPDSLKSSVQEWIERPISPRKSELVPSPEVFEYTPEALELVEQFDDFIWRTRNDLIQERKHHEIFARTAQQAAQVALIVAAGRGSKKIETPDISYGIALTKYIADCMLVIADNYVSRNAYEAEIKRILNVISKSGMITERDLMRKTQHIQPHQRKDILEYLISSEMITADITKPARGRSSRIFRCV